MHWLTPDVDGGTGFSLRRPEAADTSSLADPDRIKLTLKPVDLQVVSVAARVCVAFVNWSGISRQLEAAFSVRPLQTAMA